MVRVELPDAYGQRWPDSQQSRDETHGDHRKTVQ